MRGATPPGYWEALQEGRRPFSCEELENGFRSTEFVLLLKYAEQYNRRLLELQEAR